MNFREIKKSTRPGKELKKPLYCLHKQGSRPTHTAVKNLSAVVPIQKSGGEYNEIVIN